MSSQLHLLRGFVQWTDRRTGAPIKTIAAAQSWVEYIAGRGYSKFYTETSRRIRRADELAGGSVFFVGRRGSEYLALFRMPLLDVEEGADSWYICMRPQIVLVQPRSVGWVRGWRYLAAADAPPDLPAAEAEAAPADLRAAGLA